MFNMRYLVIITFLLINIQANAQGFLRTRDTAIVDGTGKSVILRGMGLGGWMLQEPYMLQLSGVVTTQHDIRNKITALIGKENTQTFYDAWLNNHCTKADIDSLAAWGFNSVRLPIHYNLFTLPAEEEPEKGKNTWLNKGFQLTDSLLSWCKANNIYLILDLHAAPGGQGNDIAIADRDTGKFSLWQSEVNQQKTIALWEKLAARYVNEEWIGGYDILNEPNWGFENTADRNGCSEQANAPLKKLLQDITTAIRKIDNNHIIFAEANCWANNYNGLLPLWDNNMVISFHKYWNYTDNASIQKFLDYRTQYHVPIWAGETGENSNSWFTDVVALMEKNNIGWCMWPLKKAGLNNPMQVKINAGAQQVFDYWKGKAPKPSPAAAFKALLQLADNTNAKNNIIHRDVADAMMRQVYTAETIPFKKNIINNNTVLFAADYDIGRSGVAYHDKDSAEYWVSTSKRTPWNIGGQYRNDGVDIEICKDAPLSNGYNVGWIESGEWLQYSIYVPQEGMFDISLRTAAKAAAKAKLLLNDETVSGNIALPATGGIQKWKTSTARNIKLNKGWNRLRVLAISGGFNFNYLQFIQTKNTANINR